MINKVLSHKNLFPKDFHGLFAIINGVSSVIYNHKHEDETTNWFCELQENSIYYDENIKFTDNVWEYYLEQPCNIEFKNLDSNIETSSDFFYRYSWSNWTVENHNGALNSNRAREIHDHLFHNAKNKIVFKREILNEIEKVKDSLELEKNNFISVHYRDFDVGAAEHSGHVGSKPNLDVWFKNIDELEDIPIFLSTDSCEIIEEFEKKYNSRLKCQKNIDRFYMKSYKTDINKCDSPTQSPYQHGLNAIVDCHLLSQGKYIVRQCSGFSFFSILLNPEINVINVDK
jgi:hypothetical protein